MVTHVAQGIVHYCVLIVKNAVLGRYYSSNNCNNYYNVNRRKSLASTYVLRPRHCQCSTSETPGDLAETYTESPGRILARVTCRESGCETEQR
jgi:hypothetical protein